MGRFIDEAGGVESLDSISLLGPKLLFIEQLGQMVLEGNIKGDVAEAGVYTGGCARLLATIFRDKKVYLFDSFDGFIKDDTKDCYFKKGDLKTELEVVKKNVNRKNCIFTKGWIPESAHFVSEDQMFAFVHLDMDYYQSMKDGLDLFWPRLSKGGVIVVDDYKDTCCPHIERLIEEYFGERSDFSAIYPCESLVGIWQEKTGRRQPATSIGMMKK